MDIQFAPISILNCDGEDFGFQSRPSAYFTRIARHKRANAIAGELALGLFIESLQLRYESFERLGHFLFPNAAEFHFNRLAICAEIERGFEFFGQIRERHVFAQMEMFHEGTLQMTIIRPHALCAASPGYDCSFGERFSWIRYHQIRIHHELRSQTVASRARA